MQAAHKRVQATRGLVPTGLDAVPRPTSGSSKSSRSSSFNDLTPEPDSASDLEGLAPSESPSTARRRQESEARARVQAHTAEEWCQLGDDAMARREVRPHRPCHRCPADSPAPFARALLCALLATLCPPAAPAPRAACGGRGDVHGRAEQGARAPSGAAEPLAGVQQAGLARRGDGRRDDARARRARVAPGLGALREGDDRGASLATPER